MSLIQIADLTFGYAGQVDNVFEEVSFQLDSAWKTGIIGRNGRGKTTLLKLLLGSYEYRGVIMASQDFVYFPFEIEDEEQETLQLVENLIPDLQQWELLREFSWLRLKEEVLYRSFDSLSKGEQTKVLLAALFLKENSFLLIDEPTDHLDAESRQIVSSYLKRQRGFMLVSHDRAFLDNCIDHVLAINKAGIEVQKGNYSSWWLNRERRDQFEQTENDKLLREIGHLSEASRRSAKWSDQIEKSKRGDYNPVGKKDKGYIGHQAAKMMKRSKATEQRRENAIEEKSKLLKNIERAERLFIPTRLYHADRLAEFQGLSIIYDGVPVFSGIDLRVGRGERIAISGRNGSGKSSLLKLLCGEEIPHEGEGFIGGKLQISYVSQDTAFLQGNLSAYARQRGIEESRFKAILNKLDFWSEQLSQNMETFSSGQKKKVLLAASLCDSAHLYIWDEPLNFIDVLSRIQIEELILESEPTMVLVEHDRVFLDRVATRHFMLPGE